LAERLQIIRIGKAQIAPMAIVARIVFCIAVLTTLFFAWFPHPPVLIAYDKAQHGLAFAVLTILGRAAYPRYPWQFLVLTLVGLGAIIEIVQLIPQLNRTCDIYDWYADVFAILIGLALHTSITLLRSSVRKAADAEA
jgi:hypothetical protein